MKVGIVGNGMVGSAMKHLFKDAIVYDKDTDKCSVMPWETKKSNCTKNNYDFYYVFTADEKPCNKEDINKCDVVFVCVPTDGGNKGFDYSDLEEVIGWLEVPLIVIKSTVEPGKTEELIEKTGKNIVFNPEFLREKHRFKDIENETRVILGIRITDIFRGGDQYETLKELYLSVYDEDKVETIRTDPTTAEFVKLANNAYLATKVTFVNEIKKIADKLEINYDHFRDIWLTDQRIGRSHTRVTKEGGFGGYCLPKDTKALINTAKKYGYNAKFLKEVWNSNCKFRKEFKGKEYGLFRKNRG